MLANAMLYWLTATAGSAARLYYENMHMAPAGGQPPATTPTGVAAFAEDIAIRRYGEQANNALVSPTDLERPTSVLEVLRPTRVLHDAVERDELSYDDPPRLDRTTHSGRSGSSGGVREAPTQVMSLGIGGAADSGDGVGQHV
jgi:hypothetical protein